MLVPKWARDEAPIGKPIVPIRNSPHKMDNEENPTNPRKGQFPYRHPNTSSKGDLSYILGVQISPEQVGCLGFVPLISRHYVFLGKSSWNSWLFQRAPAIELITNGMM